MARNKNTSAVIDGILEIAVSLGTISIAIIMPNLNKVLDEPTRKFLNTMEARSRERELKRLLSYVLREKLITEHYQHGVILSASAKQRLRKRAFDSLKIENPERWDSYWRLVIFDIPEENHKERSAFTYKIKQLGFQPLQQSVWIHPFPCKDIIVSVAEKYMVSKYITYIETSHIDNEKHLKKRFENVLK